MRFRTIALPIAAVLPLVLAVPALAQSAGTSLTGTSAGREGTPGQPSASNPRGMGRSDASPSTMAPATGVGENKPTATGGQPGGAASRN